MALPRDALVPFTTPWKPVGKNPPTPVGLPIVVTWMTCAHQKRG